MSIPASAIVQVNPSLLVPSGTDLELNGLFAYDSPLIPPGVVLPFPSYEAAKAYFPPNASILKPLETYFRGYDGSPIKPRVVYLARWASEDTAPYVIGTKSPSLDALKAIDDGILTLTMAGQTGALTALDFSGASSFSAVAAMVQAEMRSIPAASQHWLAATCTYDGVFKRFNIGSSYSGAEADIDLPTGSAATAMGLNVGTAFQGVTAQTPAECMDAVKSVTTNWVTFTTGKVTSIPDEEEQLAFSAWSNAQGVRYLYVLYNDSPELVEPGNTTNIGKLIQDLDLSAVAGEYGEMEYAAFLMGTAASIDYNRPDGAITTAFRSLDGLPFNVSDELAATQLEANGFNYYGNWATANDQFKFHYPGQMFGQYEWVDTYLNAIWINNALQVAMMAGLKSIGRAPFNDRGYTQVRAWMQDPILRALTSGVIDTGIVLSEAQKANVNQQAGLDIATTLEISGFYLQIKDPGPAVRNERRTPIINFWYTYGGAIQRLVVASKAVV